MSAETVEANGSLPGSLLLTLEEISRLVSQDGAPAATLANIDGWMADS